MDERLKLASGSRQLFVKPNARARTGRVLNQGQMEGAETPVSIDDLGGGQGQDRTADLRFFRPSLSQLSYLAANCPLGSELICGDDGI